MCAGGVKKSCSTVLDAERESDARAPSQPQRAAEQEREASPVSQWAEHAHRVAGRARKGSAFCEFPPCGRGPGCSLARPSGCACAPMRRAQRSTPRAQTRWAPVGGAPAPPCAGMPALPGRRAVTWPSWGLSLWWAARRSHGARQQRASGAGEPAVGQRARSAAAARAAHPTTRSARGSSARDSGQSSGGDGLMPRLKFSWTGQKNWGFPSQFIKSTKVLRATPQGRRLSASDTAQGRIRTGESVATAHSPALRHNHHTTTGMAHPASESAPSRRPGTGMPRLSRPGGRAGRSAGRRGGDPTQAAGYHLKFNSLDTVTGGHVYSSTLSLRLGRGPAAARPSPGSAPGPAGPGPVMAAGAGHRAGRAAAAAGRRGRRGRV